MKIQELIDILNKIDDKERSIYYYNGKGQGPDSINKLVDDGLSYLTLER